MAIIKVDPDVLEESSNTLTYVGAALKADDNAYQEVWVTYASASSDLPTEVGLDTSATDSARQYTSLAETAMDYAVVIRALDRNGNNRITAGEADLFLLEAALAERAADPEANSELLRERATKRVAADAAAERLSRYDEQDQTYDQEEIDQLRADLDSVKAYADVAADPLAEETRLMAAIGPRDYLAMSRMLQAARTSIGPPEDPAGRVDGDEHLTYLAGWTSRALEDQPERIDRWMETFERATYTDTDLIEENHVAVTLLATESDESTSALASAVWDAEKFRRNSLSYPQDPEYDILYDLYGTLQPAGAIVVAAGERDRLARYLMGDLQNPDEGAFSLDDLFAPEDLSDFDIPDGDLARFIEMSTVGRGTHPRKSQANIEGFIDWAADAGEATVEQGGAKTQKVIGGVMEEYFTSPDTFTDDGATTTEAGVRAQAVTSGLGKWKNFHEDLAEPLARALAPHIEYLKNLAPSTGDEYSDGASNNLGGFLGNISDHDEATQTLLTAAAVLQAARIRSEIAGPASESNLMEFNTELQQWTTFFREAAQEAGRSTKNFDGLRLVADLGVAAAVATGGVLSGGTLTVPLAMARVGATKLIDIGEKKLETTSEDDRALILKDYEASLKWRFIEVVAATPEGQELLRFSDEPNGVGSGIAADELAGVIAKAKRSTSGDAAIDRETTDAQNRLTTWLTYQGDEINDLAHGLEA